jgi:hypothetical protein
MCTMSFKRWRFEGYLALATKVACAQQVTVAVHFWAVSIERCPWSYSCLRLPVSGIPV